MSAVEEKRQLLLAKKFQLETIVELNPYNAKYKELLSKVKREVIALMIEEEL